MKNSLTLLFILFLAAMNFKAYSQKTQEERMDSIYRQKEANLPAFTFNANLVGIAFYGPMVEAEFKVSNRGYVVPWLRYSYAGIASNYMWTNFEDDSKYDPSSISLAVGYKIFKPGDNMRQLIYWGFFGEFINESGNQNMNSDYEYEQKRQSVMAYFNAGYRWRSHRNFYINLGILPGIGYDLKNEATYLNSGGPVNGIKKKLRFIGIIDFSVGWNFEK